MSIFLCYDVKGIQSFIFKVPKLRHIIGGSALIDRFDRNTALNIPIKNAIPIFTGGGKGVFRCDSQATANSLKSSLRKQAYDIGLDICFGMSGDYSAATQQADELYSFMPKNFDGIPCPESGLYPVARGEACHKVIEKRLSNEINRWFEAFLLEKVKIDDRPTQELEFFRNVNAEDEDGKLGAKALGNRNRWAVICMDGNDIGMQFRHQANAIDSEEERLDWIKAMSRTLGEMTVSAVSMGIEKVVDEWGKTDDGKKMIARQGNVVLPVRPLLVGGDDVVLLCHCSYAATFVKETAARFAEYSQANSDLWPATGGRLTISAGILYSPVTLPLHTAIPYAEALLDSAKKRGRKIAGKNQGAPACIDWEQITETLIDTPEDKRSRERIFYDEETGCRIRLTQRPYTLEQFSVLEKTAWEYGQSRAKELPRTVRHKILPALKKGSADRLAFYAEIKKNHPLLFSDLNEFESGKSSWTTDEKTGEKSIGIIDALMLLEEDDRMDKETVQ